VTAVESQDGFFCTIENTVLENPVAEKGMRVRERPWKFILYT